MTGLESSVGNGFHNVPLTVTWTMVDDMRRARLHIGSHTRSHVSLPTESPQRIAEELEASKAELESRLGEPVDHFAYPGGQFTQRDRRGRGARRLSVRLHGVPARRSAAIRC